MQELRNIRFLRPLLLIAISFATVASVLPAIPLAHATSGPCDFNPFPAGQQGVYITNSTGNGNTSPLATVGSTVTYNVCVHGITAPFNFWEVQVLTVPTVLNPIGFAIPATSVLSPVLEAVHCVNGLGSNCGIGDGSGVVTSWAVNATTASSNTGCSGVSPCSGLLFTISYTALNVPPGNSVHINYAILGFGNDPTATAITCTNGFVPIANPGCQKTVPAPSPAGTPRIRTRVTKCNSGVIPQGQSVLCLDLNFDQNGITGAAPPLPFNLTQSISITPPVPPPVPNGPVATLDNGTATITATSNAVTACCVRIIVGTGASGGALLRFSTGSFKTYGLYLFNLTGTCGASDGCSTAETLKVLVDLTAFPTPVIQTLVCPTICHPSIDGFYGTRPTLLIDAATQGVPLQDIGTTVSYSVDVANMAAFSYYDVDVDQSQGNGTLIPISVSVNPIFVSSTVTNHPSPQLICIDGHNTVDNVTFLRPACASGEVRVIANSTGAVSGNVPLFTVTYKVRGGNQDLISLSPADPTKTTGGFQECVSFVRGGTCLNLDNTGVQLPFAMYGSAAKDFLINGPPIVKVRQGSSAPLTFSVIPFNSFSDTVSLGPIVCTPSGPGISPPTITPTGVSTSQTTTSTVYACTITGTDTTTGQVHHFQFTLIVTPAGQPDFAKSGLTQSSRVPVGGQQVWTALVKNPTLTPKVVQVLVTVTRPDGTSFLVGSGILAIPTSVNGQLIFGSGDLTATGTYTFKASIIFADTSSPLIFISTTSGTAAIYSGNLNIPGMSIGLTDPSVQLASGSFTVG